MLDFIHFCEQDVIIAINKLKSKLSAGPDGLPPILFKRIKHTIATPLTLAFKQLLSVASVPEVWKCAVITLVHKNGPTTVLFLSHVCLVNYSSELQLTGSIVIWLTISVVINNAARIVLQAPRRYHANPMLRQLHWLPVRHRINYNLAVMTYLPVYPHTWVITSTLANEHKHYVHLTLYCSPYHSPELSSRSVPSDAQPNLSGTHYLLSSSTAALWIPSNLGWKLTFSVYLLTVACTSELITCM